MASADTTVVYNFQIRNIYGQTSATPNNVLVPTTSITTVQAGHQADFYAYALWRLDESGGTATGVVRSITLSNTGGNVPSGVSGQVGTARGFSGTQWLAGNAADGADRSVFLTDHSVEAWVYYDSSLNTGRATILSYNGSGETQAANTLMQFGVSSSGALFLLVETGSGVDAQVLSTNVVPSLKWTHVAFTRTGTTIRFYINGDAAGTRTLTLGDGGTTATWSLGAAYGGSDFLKGRIDDVRVSSVARTPTEIGSSYTAGGGTASSGTRRGGAFNGGFN